MGKSENGDRFCILGLQNLCWQWLQPWNLKMLASWKESYDKPRQHIKKQRHHFPDKGPYSQSHGFSSSHVCDVLLLYSHGCECWTIKKAEHWRTDAFEMWCWRRLLSVPWTARQSDQSILKEINPEYSLEGLVLKLKLQYFGHLMVRTDSLEKTLMLGKTEVRKRRGQQRMRWIDESPTQWTWIWANSRR